jgi:hypothetical protein
MRLNGFTVRRSSPATLTGRRRAGECDPPGPPGAARLPDAGRHAALFARFGATAAPVKLDDAQAVAPGAPAGEETPAMIAPAYMKLFPITPAKRRTTPRGDMLINAAIIL